MISTKRSCKFDSPNGKKSRKSLTIEMKMDVIGRMEAGERRSEVSKALDLAPSTVTTIMNNATKIKQLYSREVVSLFSDGEARSEVIEKMEKYLLMWVDDAYENNVPVTQSLIMDKARSLFYEISEELGNTDQFSESKDWFCELKNRSKFLNVKIEDDIDDSSDTASVGDYPSIFQNLMDEGGYTPDSVFNVAEMCLYWKKMPSKVYSTSEDMSASCFNESKDRFTLLLGGNASGTFKLKPMLVYHLENPRIMKGIVKTRLPVFWRSNKLASVTQTLFSEWYTSYFCPEVAKFCTENNLPNSVVLVLDDTPGHPTNLEDIPNDLLNVKVVYLPPNSSLLLQPMDQGVFDIFKTYYLQTMFQGILETVQASNSVTVSGYWESYNILRAISNIAAAWKEVSQSCMNGAWRRLWPEVVPHFLECDQISAVIEDVMRMAADIGLNNIDVDDINELLQSYSDPLSREDVKDIAVSVAKTSLEEDLDDSEVVPIRALTIKTLQASLTQIQAGCEMLCENDPDWERSSSIQRSITNMLRPYYSMLEERHRSSYQSSLLQLFPKLKEPPESDDTPSGSSD